MPSLEDWESEASAVEFLSLTLAEMRDLHARCPDPLGSGVARRLWTVIVAMVHSNRGSGDCANDWTHRLLAGGEFKEPVH